MVSAQLLDRCTALLLILLTIMVATSEWGSDLFDPLIPGLTLLVLVVLFFRVRNARRVFVGVGVALVLLLALTHPDAWWDTTVRALRSSAFIAAFFTALSTLRNVAETSPAIRAGGIFLAAQPPGRRYAALTAGGHLFALLLNYGAISLLGSLASTSAATEPDPVIRSHRTRRMLLAIQRGFVASLPWSPLAFAMAITTALIPDARWSDAVLPGLGASVILMATGWALDTIFKPRLSAPVVRKPQEGSWALMLPLLFLLALMGITVFTLHEATGIRIVGIVMVEVPLISTIWALIQWRGGAPGAEPGPRIRRYLTHDLPGYKGELTLLMMAGFIGTVGAPVLAPVIAAAGLDLGALPAGVILVALVWLIPLLGQLGMNPILAVTLLAPSIPTADALGVPPAAIVTAIVSGWAISGASSPFTATTLLIGSFGGVSAAHVGVRWNAGYVAAVLLLLSAWVLFFAYVLA